MKYLYFLLLVVSWPAWGQGSLVTLKGTVRDSVTREGIPASIVADFDRYRSGTQADTEGNFSLSLSRGSHLLIIRQVGYVPVRLSVSITRDTTIHVLLGNVSRQLEEVVVTSKGYDQTIQKPLLGVSQLNIKTLERLPAALGERDILRSLQLLPGITSVGEAANGVNIRGGTTDQNLILMDGTPIFNPTHMFGMFSVFPTDAVSGIDLYKGNVPARFAGRAAAVLDISLRNPSLETFQLKGGISLVSNRITAEIPLIKNKLSVLVSGRGAFNDFLLPLASERLKGIKSRFGDGVVKVFYRMNDRNTLTYMAYYSKDLFQTNLLGSLAGVTGSTTRYDHETFNQSMKWFIAFTPKLNLQTTLIATTYVPKIVVPDSVSKAVLTSGINQLQAQSSLNYQGKNHKLEAGVSAIRYRLSPGNLSGPGITPQSVPTEHAWELGVHLEDERSISERLAVSAGIRYSYFMNVGPAIRRLYTGLPSESAIRDTLSFGPNQVLQSYGGLEPRIGIRYSLGSTGSLKLGYNLMRQYLQVVTNTTTPLPTARWKTSDLHIKPQVSQLVSAGWFQNFRDNIYEFSLEGYYRTTENVLDYRPGADFLLQPYPETQLLSGRNKSYGIETMISRKKGELTGWITYTYARSFNQIKEGNGFLEQINDGNWYASNYDRPHSFNSSVTISPSKFHSFSFTFAYSTGRPYTAPEGYVVYQNRVYPFFSDRNQRRLPDYHRLDFSWDIYNPSLKKKRWEGHWTFTIYNLYGRKNVYSVFYRSQRTTIDAYSLQVFAAPLASLAYHFTFS